MNLKKNKGLEVNQNASNKSSDFDNKVDSELMNWRKDLDSVLYLEQITVSEELIAKTMERVTHIEPVEQKKKGLYGKLAMWATAAAAIVLLAVAIRNVRLPEKNEMSTDTSTERLPKVESNSKAEPMADGTQDSERMFDAVTGEWGSLKDTKETEDSTTKTDVAENSRNESSVSLENANSYKNTVSIEEEACSEELLNGTVLPCGTEDGFLYFVYCYPLEVGYQNLLCRINITGGKIERLTEKTTKLLPEGAEYKEHKLRLFCDGEWLE